VISRAMAADLVQEGLSVVALAALAAAVCEAISWLLFYRTDSYRDMRQAVERTNQKIAKAQEEAARSKEEQDAKGKARAKAKRVARFEEDLRLIDREIGNFQRNSTLAVVVVSIFIYAILCSSYEGVVVARLPFEPFEALDFLARRGLLGDDRRECSGALLYSLALVSFRSNLQKALGFCPPKKFAQVQAARQQAAYIHSKHMTL